MSPLIFLSFILIPNQSSELDKLHPLLEAVRFKESSNIDSAVGDNGASKGPYQCQRAAWQDACEFGGVDWDYDEFVWNRENSEYVFYWYTTRYGAKTHEERSRCWNSGPKWRKKYHLTNEYWGDIKRIMEK